MDTFELAWDDALRASALRDIVITLIALAVLLASGFAIALFSLSGRPQQHYLRRLSPDVAATGPAQAQLTAQANMPGSTAR